MTLDFSADDHPSPGQPKSQNIACRNMYLHTFILYSISIPQRNQTLKTPSVHHSGIPIVRSAVVETMVGSRGLKGHGGLGWTVVVLLRQDHVTVPVGTQNKVPTVAEDQDQGHEEGVKGEQGPLVGEEVPLGTFGELDDTDDVPDRNDDAHDVQDPQAQLPPRARECFGMFGTDAPVHAEMPLDGDEHEEEKDDDLEDQTA